MSATAQIIKVLWRRSFRYNLLGRLSGLVDNLRDVWKRIHIKAGAIYKTEAQLGSTQASAFSLYQCCLLLAAYHELEDELGDGRLSVLGEVQEETLSWFSRSFLRKVFRLVTDPFALVRRIDFPSFLGPILGPGMKLSQINEEQYFGVTVHRCVYWDFCNRHGCAELTLLFCAWDWSWMETVNTCEKDVRVERKSTISKGAGRCEFQIHSKGPIDEQTLDCLEKPLEESLSDLS